MSIPENFFVGKDGLIHFYSSGFSPFHENVTLMRIKALLGIENPPLLSEKQFNGSDSCMTCHPGEYASWSITPHAHSFQTLVVKGHENDVECIGCHSLGFKDPRGYPVREDPKTKKQIAVVPEPFQNVQCEHCHGIGGPHVKDAIVYKAADMEKMCLECHTEKFSLHFNFAERIKKTDHSDMQTILDMTPEQRIALLKKVSKSPDDLFGSHVKYVGSDSCLSCHANEHAAWKNSTHGKKTDVKWETTAFQENLTRENNAASCESCHGPGEKHVKSKKQADIRGLGDDCPFCVVEQICLSCHSAQKGFNTQTAVEKIKGHK